MKWMCIALLPLISSCIVINNGNVSGGPLLSAYDKYVDNATGSAADVSFILFTELTLDKQVKEAKQRMFRNRPLHPGEYYSNFTCDISRLYVLFGVLVHNRVTVSADVLQTNDKPPGQTADTLFAVREFFNLTPGREFIYKKDTLFIGDTVYYREKKGDVRKYVIARVTGHQLMLSPIAANMPALTLHINDEVFSTKGKLYGIGAGDRISVRGRTTYLNVVGVSGNRYLVRQRDKFIVLSKTAFENDLRPGDEVPKLRSRRKAE
jgi:hypothetical protein